MRNPCDDRSGFSLIRWGMVFFPEIYWLCHPLIDWSEIFKPDYSVSVICCGKT